MKKTTKRCQYIELYKSNCNCKVLEKKQVKKNE